MTELEYTPMSRAEFHKRQEEILKKTSAKPRHVAEALTTLEKTFNFTPSEGHQKALQTLFSRTEVTVLAQGIEEYIMTNKWYPKPADIRDIFQRTSALPYRLYLNNKARYIMEKPHGKRDLRAMNDLLEDFLDERLPSGWAQTLHKEIYWERKIRHANDPQNNPDPGTYQPLRLPEGYTPITGRQESLTWWDVTINPEWDTEEDMSHNWDPAKLPDWDAWEKHFEKNYKG